MSSEEGQVQHLLRQETGDWVPCLALPLPSCASQGKASSLRALKTEMMPAHIAVPYGIIVKIKSHH